MIEVSALPSIAQLLGAATPQGEVGEESPISAQFAQLLSLKLGIAPANPQAPEAAALPGHAMPQPEDGQPSGKPHGKPLPEPMPAVAGTLDRQENETQPAADAFETLGSETKPAAEAAPQASAAVPIPEPLAEIQAMPIAIVVPPAITKAAPDASLRNDGKSSTERSAKALPIMPAASRLPGRLDLTPPPLPAATANPQPAPTRTMQTGPAPALASETAGPAVQPFQFLQPAPAAPFAPALQNLAPLRLIPRKAEAGEAIVPPDFAEPIPATPAAAGAEPARIAVAATPTAQLAASLRQLLARPEAETLEPVRTLSPAAEAEPLGPAVGLSGNAPIAASAPPQTSPEFASPRAAAPVAAAATSAPATGPEAPRDFVQLIDRLVEAREAVRSAQLPQSVEAAIAHAEFGHVSLRFEQDGGALSISLASPDPDFARAVQAAAPASQQGAMQDNSGAPQRGDAQGQGQQGPNSAPGQPHSQQRGQTSAQQTAEPRERAAPQSQPNGEAKPQRRNGIFA